MGALTLSLGAQAAWAADAPLALEEVVVTAERRETLAQKTPITLTVLGGEQLKTAGVVEVQDLPDYVPSLQIGEGSRSAIQIAIRGVYSAANEADPSTAFHVDGVYYTRPSGGNAVFYDLERLEVLRGPQGTLWGRNATAGSINVVTQKPRWDYEGAAEVGFGDYDLFQVQGAVNLPILDDRWAIRAAFLSVQRDAYERNTRPGAPNPGVDDVAFRIHSLFRFSDKVSLLLSADHWEKTGQSNSFVSPASGYSRRTSPNSSIIDVEAQTLRAELTVDFTGLQFVSLSAYRQEDQLNDGPVHAAPGNGVYDIARPIGLLLDLKDETFSQEFRLSSAGDGRLHWTLGAIYLDQKTDELFRLAFVPNFNQLTQVRPDQSNRSYAAFGHATYDLTDTVSLIGGLRYSQDAKKNTGGRATQITNGVAVTQVENVSDSWDRLDWKIGVDWQVRPQSLIYATASTGYKAGGIANSSYDAEKLLAFEVGAKNQFFDNRLQVNLAAFAYDYTDLQVGHIVNGRVITDNASSATIRGAELEFQALPFQGLRLSGSLSYVDGEYGDYLAVDASANNQVFQVSGNRIQRAPRVSSRLSAVYTFAVPGGDLSLKGDWAYQSKIYFSEFENRGIWALATQKAVSTFDANVRYAEGEGRWYVDAWIKNITDEDVANSIGFYGPARTLYATYAPPKTYGLRIGANF